MDKTSISKAIPTKNVQRVVHGRIRKKKKTFLDNLGQVFFGSDTENVGQYILFDVLLPAAKNTISEMVSSGIEMLLFGEARRSSRSKERSYTSYGSYFKQGTERRPERVERSAPRGVSHDFDDLVLENREEAQNVLDNLVEIVDTYDSATVADFYDLMGITSTFADHKYGWVDLAKASVERVRDGYIIDLPKPIIID